MITSDLKEKGSKSDYWSSGNWITDIERFGNVLANYFSPKKATRREIWQHIRREGLSFVIWQQRPYTVVDASYGDTSGRGVTKWNHKDAGIPGLDWNSRRGIDIARGRAIKDLLDQLETRANGG